MEKVNISQKQAQAFARAIYANIDAYIEAHREEYEKFLLEEETGNGEDDKI